MNRDAWRKMALKRAGIKLAVVGNSDDLALAVGTGADQLDVAATLRGPGEPKSLEDGNQVPAGKPSEPRHGPGGPPCSG